MKAGSKKQQKAPLKHQTILKSPSTGRTPVFPARDYKIEPKDSWLVHALEGV